MPLQLKWTYHWIFFLRQGYQRSHDAIAFVHTTYICKYVCTISICKSACPHLHLQTPLQDMMIMMMMMVMMMMMMMMRYDDRQGFPWIPYVLILMSVLNGEATAYKKQHPCRKKIGPPTDSIYYEPSSWLSNISMLASCSWHCFGWCAYR